MEIFEWICRGVGYCFFGFVALSLLWITFCALVEAAMKGSDTHQKFQQDVTQESTCRRSSTDQLFKNDAQLSVRIYALENKGKKK